MTCSVFDDLTYMQNAAKTAGYGDVSEIVHKATILHNDWEADNYGWVVKMKDGSLKGFTTLYNSSLQLWTADNIAEKINETTESLQSLKKALDLINK